MSWFVVGAIGCVDDVPVIEPVLVESATLTIDDQGRFRDRLGRDVIMRGLNTGNRSKFEPFFSFEFAADEDLSSFEVRAREFFVPFRRWGLDTVRLPFSWEALEPEKGTVDSDYLDRYEVVVNVAWGLGLRVIVDFHQDVFASPFCGDGFPLWTLGDGVEQPPRRDCPFWFLGYLNDAGVGQAFDRFWNNDDGIQDDFRQMWATVATRFASNPGVVGFEVINEPFRGTAEDTSWRREVLVPFYSSMAEHIRSVASEKLVFYDGSGLDSSEPDRAIHPVVDKDFVVFAPHYYDGPLLVGSGWSGDEPAPHIASFAHFREEHGIPVILGEFGYPNGKKGGPSWLSRTMDALDDARLSATLWEYSRSAQLWNGEDLSVTDADGTERDILNTYVRPWIPALAGRDLNSSWDPSTGLFTATWTADQGVTEIKLPPRIFGEGPPGIGLSGRDASLTWDPERAEVRVRAPAGQVVSLRIEP
jgi:endoglycosylceramidase